MADGVDPVGAWHLAAARFEVFAEAGLETSCRARLRRDPADHEVRARDEV